MTPLLEVPVLSGRLVRLEALRESHVEQLSAAAAEDRSSYGYTAVPEGRSAVEKYVADLLRSGSAGEIVPFAQVRLSDERAVGCTRYMGLRYRSGASSPYAVEIGGTWLAASAQRTGINAEAKLLLLTYAFETLHVGRVDLVTDARNERSRTAILGLGAVFEGVLRNCQPSSVAGEETALRDTAVYSIIPSEWPAVRARLQSRLRP